MRPGDGGFFLGKWLATTLSDKILRLISSVLVGTGLFLTVAEICVVISGLLFLCGFGFGRAGMKSPIGGSWALLKVDDST